MRHGIGVNRREWRGVHLISALRGKKIEPWREKKKITGNI